MKDRFTLCSYSEYKKANPEAKKVAAYYRHDSGVYFSATKKGNGVEIHIAAPSRAAKKSLRVAVNEFCTKLINEFLWCKMIIATIRKDRRSVMNLAKKCGFEWIGDTKPDGWSIYVRFV